MYKIRSVQSVTAVRRKRSFHATEMFKRPVSIYGYFTIICNLGMQPKPDTCTVIRLIITYQVHFLFTLNDDHKKI